MNKKRIKCLMSECHSTKSLSSYVKIVLGQKVREFASFFSGVEGRFVFSYVKCVKQA